MIPDIQVFSPSQGRQPRIPSGGGGVEVAEPLVVQTLLDEEVRQPYLEVIDLQNQKVVTVIEVLSPDNKVSRPQGLESFRLKRETIMKSGSHWVEIDLLRSGVSLAVRQSLHAHEYFVHVSPVGLRPQREAWSGRSVCPNGCRSSASRSVVTSTLRSICKRSSKPPTIEWITLR